MIYGILNLNSVFGEMYGKKTLHRFLYHFTIDATTKRKRKINGAMQSHQFDILQTNFHCNFSPYTDFSSNGMED